MTSTSPQKTLRQSLLRNAITASLALTAVLALAMNTAHAATIAGEKFIYASGDLAGNNGGQGWDGAWFSSQGGNGAIAAGSLAYSDGTNTLATAGDRALITAGSTSQNLIRNIDLTQPALSGLTATSGNIGADGASIWFSFLGQFGDVDGIDSEGGDLTWMRDGNTASSAAVSIGEGSNSPNGVWQVKLPQNIGVNTNVLDFDINTPGIQSRSMEESTYFVGRIDYGTSLDTLHLWLDPDLDSVPVDAQANFSDTSANLEIDRVRLAAHRNSSNWDEIGMATTFEDLFGAGELLPSNASFATGSDQDLLNIDFGTVNLGSSPAAIDFDIANLLAAGITAGVELESVTGSGDTGVLTSDLAPFVDLAGGDSLPFAASFDTNALGAFGASYELNFTDVLGTNQTLTLNLSGMVEMIDDPNIPDLIYNAATGEVILDPDASTIIGYVLKNATNGLLPGGHTPILGGVSTSLPSEISEASFGGPAVPTSIGFVMPTGMDIIQLFNFLSTNEVSRSFGSPIVPFDLIVIPAPVPEPSTYAMVAMGLLGLLVYRRLR